MANVTKVVSHPLSKSGVSASRVTSLQPKWYCLQAPRGPVQERDPAVQLPALHLHAPGEITYRYSSHLGHL